MRHFHSPVPPSLRTLLAAAHILPPLRIKCDMKNSELIKKDAADILRASLIALILSLLLVLLFALIVRWAALDGAALTVGNYVIKALAVLVGVCIGFKHPTGGAVKGGVTGIVYTLLTVFVFAVADGFRSANFNFADLLTTVVTGVIAGVIAVNLPRRGAKRGRGN